MSKKQRIDTDNSLFMALASMFENGWPPPAFELKQVVWDNIVTIQFHPNEGGLITTEPTDEKYTGDVTVTKIVKYKPEN
ncbi:hypothetical protein WKW77_30615 [Variovorax ureilyticus]|uniref:Uncharacterized protein n=1 Tax=Variovorax ureilyticus TaxID=1836198 RepID=A0ABU8VP69_9BURK